MGSIKKMHRSKDVRGLVRALEKAPANIAPYILDFLNEYDDLGYLNAMLEAGLSDRIYEIMIKDWHMSMRRSVSLIVKFVGIDKGGEFLDEETTGFLVKMLSDADIELKNWITYCLPTAISKGYGQVIIDEGGLPILMEQLDSFDQYLVCVTLVALSEMERAGFQWNLWRHEIAFKLRSLIVNEDPNIRCYAQELNLNMNKWNNMTKSEGDVIKEEEKGFTVIKKEKKVNKKEEDLKNQTGDNAYVRPRSKEIPKKKGRKKVTISSTGRSSGGEDEEMVELPSTSTKPLLERLKEKGKRSSGEEEDEDEDFEITL